MAKLKITSKELLDKQFRGVRNGYDPLEVDIFLDQILSDYRMLESLKLLTTSEHNELINRLSELEEKNKQLEIENASMRSKFSNIKKTDFVTKDNIDLIKRINSLEKFLFENGYDPSKIK